ncbi:MAG: hypothetical protein RLZZ399_455 [Verrucomicrobiota bacterium]|jgi:hypothetical protein
MDKTNPSAWLALKPQSIITVSDAQGIQDSMRRGLGVRGIDYTVRSIEQCTHVDGFSKHLFLTLADPEQTVYLMVKIVDEWVDLYLYFEPPDLAGGARADLLDRGMFWLFEEPQDASRYDPAELRYTRMLSQWVPDPSGGANRELIYRMKSQGEIQCHHVETPARQGMSSRMLATLVEYRADEAGENPEFLILEVGEMRSTRSFVRFFQGCPITLAEVDVLGIQ